MRSTWSPISNDALNSSTEAELQVRDYHPVSLSLLQYNVYGVCNSIPKLRAEQVLHGSPSAAEGKQLDVVEWPGLIVLPLARCV